MSKDFFGFFFNEIKLLYKLYYIRKLQYSEIRNDTEPDTNYVRVMDPRAEEISFVRTSCSKKQALYVSCDSLGKL